MNFAQGILICLVFVQVHAGLWSEHSDLERGRYMLVEIDDEHLDKIADGQDDGGSSSSSSSSEEDHDLQTIPGTVLSIHPRRRRPAHRRIFPRRQPRWFHRPRPMMHHGMPMRPHPMIAWRPVITWHKPMWMHRPYSMLKRPMMRRHFGGPFRPMGGPQRPIRPEGPGFRPSGSGFRPVGQGIKPAGPGFRPATQDTSKLVLKLFIL